MDFIIQANVVAVLLWVALAVKLRGRPFEFDTLTISLTGRHSFHALFAIYRKIYGAIFIFGSIIPIIVMPLPSAATFRLALALSAIYALFMILWLTYQYEIYQHLRFTVNGRSPYTGWKYAVTFVLGAMSPVLFAIGLAGVVYAR